MLYTALVIQVPIELNWLSEKVIVCKLVTLFPESPNFILTAGMRTDFQFLEEYRIEILLFLGLYR